MEINHCTPVLNRYDRLLVQIGSLLRNTIVPNIHVIDNGGKIDSELPEEVLNKIHIYQPSYNIGVAASWNWFIQNVPEIRIISNDDVHFDRNAMELFLTNYDEDSMLYPIINPSNQFSCFLLPDKIINQVGLFDENLSPNYAYFEDNDYSYRMQLLKINRKEVPNLKVYHEVSSTLKIFNAEERKQHHAKFKLAKSNYILKWGGEPEHEIYQSPFNHHK